MARIAMTMSSPVKLKCNMAMRPVRINQMESKNIPKSLILIVPPLHGKSGW
jgi:hypothetical protein